jgi:hypothetical protein
MVHNASETPFRRQLGNFPKNVLWMREVIERFLNTLHCMDACFIGNERLERLPEFGMVGKSRVGGVNINRPRIRLAIRAVLALSTAPAGFTAGDVARKVQSLGGVPGSGAYGTPGSVRSQRNCEASNACRKKETHAAMNRYPTVSGTMTALVVLHDDVINSPQTRPSAVRNPPIDAHYSVLRHGMRDLFQDLGTAA